jgi:branched-chain amino acid transport system ATP-binding protein
LGRGVLLEIRSLEVGYSRRKVLHGIDLDVSAGEVVALIGHNGGGKSTALKAIFGLLPPWKGSVLVRGERIHPSPRKMLERGVVLVLQGGRVFEGMTVLEHIKLRLAMRGERPTRKSVEDATCEFPILKDRLHQKAGLLSGGERQMLALGSAVQGNASVMLLDEPSLGLAPKMVAELLVWVRKAAQESGVGVLLVEQKVRAALAVSDRAYVLRRGRISFTGDAGELVGDSAKLREAYL